MNTAFERIFKEILPSIHIFDYMEADVIDAAKLAIQEVFAVTYQWSFTSLRYHKASSP